MRKQPNEKRLCLDRTEE